jgi:hypothetical protein
MEKLATSKCELSVFLPTAQFLIDSPWSRVVHQSFFLLVIKSHERGTHERELVQEDVRFLGFESFLKEKKLKRDLGSTKVNVVPD